jgi:putative acetyltransferase
MGDGPPEAQVYLGGKATYVANALRTTRSTSAAWRHARRAPPYRLLFADIVNERSSASICPAFYGNHYSQAEPADAEAMWKCYTAPLVVRNTLQLPYRSLESVRELLTRSGECDHILVAVVDNEVVGVVGLHTSSRPRANHKGEIGMMVRDDWQGKGVGAEIMRAVINLADKWLNLTRIELTVFTDNESAIALYRKFGFEIEGTLRKYAFRDGQFVDAYAMARVK